MKIDKRRNLTAAQTALIMSVLTLGSKLIGFVREMVLAGVYGTSYVVDAYVMSQSIPSIIFAGIFGAIATAYMPLLSHKMENEGERAADVLTSQIVNLLLIVSAVSAIIGVVFSDQIVAIFAQGFNGETATLTSFFIKVTFSYTLFTSVAGIFDSFLQYKRTFIPQIIIGYTQSICTIITIVICAFTSEYYLAFGLLAAYIIRLVITYLVAQKRGLKYTSECTGMKETTKQIMTMAIPVFIGSSVSQINIVIDKFLASGLPEGSVSALNYANLLNSMVMALTITVLTTLIYPRFAQASAINDTKGFNALLQRSINLIFITTLPFSLGAMVYSGQIVQIVYERGAFDVAATILTGSPYLFYSVGMLFLSLNIIFTRVYYALNDTKTPMIFAGIGVITNLVLNLILIVPMAHGGLALATSISAMVNTGLLYIGLKKYHSGIYPIENVTKLLKIVAAAVISVGCSFGAYKFVIMPMAGVIYMRMVQVGLAVSVAIVVYFILLKLLDIKELGIIKELFKR